jgi:hypothetical protein
MTAVQCRYGTAANRPVRDHDGLAVWGSGARVPSAPPIASRAFLVLSTLTSSSALSARRAGRWALSPGTLGPEHPAPTSYRLSTAVPDDADRPGSRTGSVKATSPTSGSAVSPGQRGRFVPRVIAVASPTVRHTRRSGGDDAQSAGGRYRPPWVGTVCVGARIARFATYPEPSEIQGKSRWRVTCTSAGCAVPGRFTGRSGRPPRRAPVPAAARPVGGCTPHRC